MGIFNSNFQAPRCYWFQSTNISLWSLWSEPCSSLPGASLHGKLTIGLEMAIQWWVPHRLCPSTAEREIELYLREMKSTNKLTFMKDWLLGGYSFLSNVSLEFISISYCVSKRVASLSQFSFPFPFLKWLISFPCTRWLALLFSKPILYDERKNTEEALETN